MLKPSLFPDTARFCYVITDKNQPDLQNYLGLHPLEQALVSHSVDVRKAEFGDARWCAHQALSDLGEWNNEPILRGERGMPLWPRDITGSMTHTEGFRAAVVAPKTHVRSMGLDAEPAQPLPREVVSSIARPGEMPQLERLQNEGIDCADRLLFCAKEATYKAWFPLTHRCLTTFNAKSEAASRLPMLFLVHDEFADWMLDDGYVIAATAVT